MATKSPKPTKVSAYECTVIGTDWHRVINHSSAGKARYDYLRDLRDSYPDITFADIKVRKVGEARTSEAFKRTAAYRGMPDIQCGQRVQVLMPGDKPVLGFIVGHNESANFDVLFDEDTIFKGCVGNVHPSEIKAVAA